MSILLPAGYQTTAKMYIVFWQIASALEEDQC